MRGPQILQSFFVLLAVATFIFISYFSGSLDDALSSADEQARALDILDLELGLNDAVAPSPPPTQGTDQVVSPNTAAPSLPTTLAPTQTPSQATFPNKTGYVMFQPINSGLGDRFRGLVVAYHLAKILGRAFLAKDIAKNGARVVSQYRVDGINLRSLEEWRFTCNACSNSLGTVDFDKLHEIPLFTIISNFSPLSQLVDNPTLKTKPGYPAFLQGLRNGTLYHQPLAEVMKPAGNVTLALERLQKTHPTEGYFTIGVHFRTTDEHMRKKRGVRTQPSLVPLFIEKILEVWRSLPEKKRETFPLGMQVFLATDNPYVRRDFIARFAKLKIRWLDASEVASAPTHIRHTEDQTRTFVDWFFLSETQFIVASRSGFSETAARRGCVDIIVARGSEFTAYANGTGLCTPETDLRWLS